MEKGVLVEELDKIFIENIINKRNFNSGDGLEKKLDFTYIDDLVCGIICAID